MPPNPPASPTPRPGSASRRCCWSPASAHGPGLHGGFVFDDFVNLDALGRTGRIDGWAAFWRYRHLRHRRPDRAPAGAAQLPARRERWPADPWPFLRTTCCCISPTARCCSCCILGNTPGGRASMADQVRARVKGTPPRCSAPACGCCIPLFVSTTLYIVQREAMLAPPSCLLGLLAWGHARIDRAGAARRRGVDDRRHRFRNPAGDVVQDQRRAAAAAGWCWTRRVPARWRNAAGEAVAHCAAGAARPAAVRLRAVEVWRSGRCRWIRGRGPSASVLTEPRVLLDYLRLLLVPRVLSNGVYNDDYAWSTGLAASGVDAAGACWRDRRAGRRRLRHGGARRRWQPPLFFFAGHLLESTTIPLELYFEHRNYLPALLLGWPLARVRWCAWYPGRRARARSRCSCCRARRDHRQRATLWADHPRTAACGRRPIRGSSRRHRHAGAVRHKPNASRPGDGAPAEPWKRRPVRPATRAQLRQRGACAGSDDRTTSRRWPRRCRNNRGDQLVFRWLATHAGTAQAGGCPGPRHRHRERWTHAALANPRLASMPGRRRDLHSVLGRIALARGDTGRGLARIPQRARRRLTPDGRAAVGAARLQLGHPAEGLALLDHYAAIAPLRKRADGWNMPRMHEWVLERQGYWRSELRRTAAQDAHGPGCHPEAKDNTRYRKRLNVLPSRMTTRCWSLATQDLALKVCCGRGRSSVLLRGPLPGPAAGSCSTTTPTSSTTSRCTSPAGTGMRGWRRSSPPIPASAIARCRWRRSRSTMPSPRSTRCR